MKNFMILAACAATFYACSSNDVNTPDINENTTGLLSVSTSVLTQNSKGTKTVNGTDAAQTGPVMDTGLAAGAKIGVFVFNKDNFEGYTGATNSISALNQLWTAGTISDGKQPYSIENAFTLGIQPAKVYAYFPYSSTIPFTDRTEPKLNVTPGYTDYLYGQSPNVNSTNTKAAIQLNHALAMISFTFTRGANYPKNEDCQVNAITIEKLAESATMSVVNGVTVPTKFIEGTSQLNVKGFVNNDYVDATGKWINQEFNFKPETEDGTKTIGAVETSGTVTTAPLFHALVLPNTNMPGLNNNKVDITKLHAVIKIDGVNYEIALNVGVGTNGSGDNKWESNKHYTYNLKISGNSGQGNILEVSSVTVRQWTAGGSSDIEI